MLHLPSAQARTRSGLLETGGEVGGESPTQSLSSLLWVGLQTQPITSPAHRDWLSGGACDPIRAKETQGSEAGHQDLEGPPRLEKGAPREGVGPRQGEMGAVAVLIW